MSKIDLVTKYKQDLDLNYGLWEGNVINSFSKAYDTAYHKYNETIKAQKEADKKALERKAAFLFIAAAILGGTALTAIFGQSGLKAAVKEAALDVICRNNMKRTFEVAAIMETNPIASFALGGVLFNEFTNRLKGAAQDGVKAELKGPGYNVTSPTPFNRYITMKDTLDDARNLALSKVYAHIRDNDQVSEAQARQLLQELYKAAIMKPPRTDRYNEKTAYGIELVMFLNLIMTRDFVMEQETVSTFEMTSSRSYDISAAPGTPGYPTERNDGLGNSLRIGYRDIGDKIVDRVNWLHNKILESNLIKKGFMTNLDKDEFQKAHRSLQQLANLYSPAALF